MNEYHLVLLLMASMALVLLFGFFYELVFCNPIMMAYRNQVCTCGCSRDHHMFYSYCCMFHRVCKEFHHVE